MHARRRALGLGAAILMGSATLVLGTGVAFASGAPSSATGSSAPPPPTPRVTICHATGPDTYVVEKPSELAVLNGQYATHQDARDIIPPFTLHGKSYPGRNWTSAGQAILRAGCVDKNAPKPAPKPAPTPVTVVTGDDESAEAAAADVVPTSSTHAGEYTGGWTGGQWAAAAVAVSGVATTGGALLRRRAVQRG